MAFYLDFEKKIEDIQKELEVAKIKNDESAVRLYEKELQEEIKKIYSNLLLIKNYNLLVIKTDPMQ